ncbi:MAG: hypothetical protein ACRC46_08660 [Thermoguttaceae bacterium]
MKLQHILDKSRLSVLVIGQIRRAEFASVASDVAAERVTVFESVHDVESFGESEFDLVVVCQSFPGEFSPAFIDRVRAAMPLVPIVVVLGAWCEGEERTGSAPLRGVARITATQWPGWGQRELDTIRRGVCSRSMLPATSGDDERSLAETLPRITSTISVSIHGVDRAMTAMLNNFLTTQGFTVTNDNSVADWTLVDVADVSSERLRATFEPLVCSSRVVAIMHSPRSDEVAAMQEYGVAAVFPKPINMFSLQYFLENCERPISVIPANA